MIEFIEQSSPAYGPPSPVPIIQEETEFSQLLDLYRTREPKHVLEVGTYAGGTFFHWLQNATPGTTVVSVDGYGDYDNSELYPSWTPPGVSYEVVRGNTLDLRTAEEARQFGPYDWIFIDAGHLDGEVRSDWRLYGSMAAEHAVVAFHDIIQYEGLPRVQVWKLWGELKKQFETVEITDGGSGIGVVFL